MLTLGLTFLVGMIVGIIVCVVAVLYAAYKCDKLNVDQNMLWNEEIERREQELRTRPEPGH
jgi:hypothetical protein